jgi:hypothetical protein
MASLIHLQSQYSTKTAPDHSPPLPLPPTTAPYPKPGRLKVGNATFPLPFTNPIF